MPRTTVAQREAAEAVDAATETEPNDETQTDMTRAALSVFEPGWEELGLVAKLARISGMIGTIPKRGYNAFHKYHYVTEADLVSSVRQYLAASDIIIIPSVISETTESLGDRGELTKIMVRYTVVDSHGNELTFDIPGYGSDKGDKGVYKAMTGSMKYALMKLFKVDTGDDPEQDTRVDERAAVSQSRPAPVIRQGDRGDVQRGGHIPNATDLQIRRISETAKVLELTRGQIIDALNIMFNTKLVLPDDEGAQSNFILQTLKGLTGAQAGDFLGVLEERARITAGAPVSEY